MGGDEFADYTFKITGGIDKQGFPMKQGILVPDRVRLLLKEGSGGFNMKKAGDRKRRSVRGCIVSREISVVHLIVARRGKEPIPDVTNKVLPRRLGPKRANNIRKLFNLEKSDDVRMYVVRREVQPKEGSSRKPKTKAPKIQRLITPERLQRKRRRASKIRKQREHSKQAAAAYAALLAQRNKEKRAALMSKKSRNSARLSQR